MTCVQRNWVAVAAMLGCLAVQPAMAAGDTAGEVDVTPSQLRFVTVVPAQLTTFSVDQQAVGNTDFNQDQTVPVSPPYQGRILQVLVSAGQDVHKGQVLFSIDSPDLVQAESTLLSSAATLEVTNAALKRAKLLYAAQGMAQKDYQQAVADQQTAEAAYKAAVDAVRIFGKTDAQMAEVVKNRRIDSAMPVRSPVDGRVVSRNAAPGMLVQPGATPAPLVVADLRTKWLVAMLPESEMPLAHLGQTVDVRLMAYPGEVFHGKINFISPAVDPNTHRVTLRAEIKDPGNRIAPQMLATFVLHTGKVMRSIGIPFDGVVREGNGTMTAWVTPDRRHFYRRNVTLGMDQNGLHQVLSGLQPGELVATDGALFLSNAFALGDK